MVKLIAILGVHLLDLNIYIMLSVNTESQDKIGIERYSELNYYLWVDTHVSSIYTCGLFQLS